MSLFESMPEPTRQASKVDLADYGYQKYTVCLVIGAGKGYKTKNLISVIAKDEEHVCRHPTIREFLSVFTNGTIEITKAY